MLCGINIYSSLLNDLHVFVTHDNTNVSIIKYYIVYIFDLIDFINRFNKIIM